MAEWEVREVLAGTGRGERTPAAIIDNGRPLEYVEIQVPTMELARFIASAPRLKQERDMLLEAVRKAYEHAQAGLPVSALLRRAISKCQEG